MTGNITFTMVKPEAVAAGNTAAILNMMVEGGFKIKALKMTMLSSRQAEQFYEVHKERPFFPELVSFMSSGPVAAAILEKENAVEAFRNFIGSTNPADAAEGTIRQKFGSNIQENAVHGSDSDENASREASFFFSLSERF